MSGTPQLRPADPCDAHPSVIGESRAQATTLESLLFALLLALLAPVRRRSPASHPAPPLIPGQRQALGRAPHALAFALRLVPDWIFTARDRGMSPRARIAPCARPPAARDPPG